MNAFHEGATRESLAEVIGLQRLTQRKLVRRLSTKTPCMVCYFGVISFYPGPRSESWCMFGERQTVMYLLFLPVNYPRDGCVSSKGLSPIVLARLVSRLCM